MMAQSSRLVSRRKHRCEGQLFYQKPPVLSGTGYRLPVEAVGIGDKQALGALRRSAASAQAVGAFADQYRADINAGNVLAISLGSDRVGVVDASSSFLLKANAFCGKRRN